MKKRIVLLIAMLVALLASLTVTASAADTVGSGTCGADGDNLTWTLDSDGLLTISGEGRMSNYSLDDDTRPWGDYNDRITAVHIGPGVEFFTPVAFARNSGLTAYTVDEDNEAYCAENGVVFSADKTQLLGYPAGKTDTVYTVPDGVTEIGHCAFYANAHLTGLNLPETLTEIGGFAFVWCGKLERVVLPASLTKIGDYAFTSCTALTEIIFEGDAPTIGEHTFFDVTAVVYCPVFDANWTEDAVQQYGGTLIWLPYGACGEGLKWTLSYNGTLTISGSGAMENYADEGAPWYPYASVITAVVLEEGVTSIGTYAFYGCNKLTSVSIAKSVASMGKNAFLGCAALTTITAAEDSAAFSVVDGVLFNKAQTELLLYPNGKSSAAYTVPDTVTRIGHTAFTYSFALTCVTLPEGLTDIGNAAFFGCTKLGQITIPGNVASIEKEAFGSCPALKRVTFTGNAPTFGENVFYIDNLTCCYPIGDESWTEDVMQPYGGTVTWVPYGTCGESLTWTLDGDGLLIIQGSGTMTNFTTAAPAPWAQYSSGIKRVVIEQGVTTIGSDAFYNCTALTGVTIPTSVTTIGRRAFMYSGLTSVSIPEGVTTIGSQAFWECKALQSVTIPASVTTIQGQLVFHNCTALTAIEVAQGNTKYTDVDGVLFNKSMTELEKYPAGKTAATYTIPAGVTEVVTNAFSYNAHLTAVTIPEGVSIIGVEAFDQCAALTGVVLPSTVTTIGAYSFAGTALTKLTIPAAVTGIGKGAFEDSTLTEITFGDSVPTFDGETFLGVTATAYYPAGSTVWTSEVMQNYGGTITWKKLGGDAALDINGILTVYGPDAEDGAGWSWENGVLTLNGTAEGFVVKAVRFTDAIESAKITLSGDTTLDTDGIDDYECSAIRMERAGSALEIDSGEYTLRVNCAGFLAYAVYTEGSLTIPGGELEVTADFSGIFVREGDLTITDAAVSVSGCDSDCIEVHGVRDDEGVLSGYGVLTITNSTVSATQSGSNGIYCDGDMLITESTVTADGGNNGLGNDRGDMVFTDSTITATGNFAGICTYGTLTFDNSTVTAVGDAEDPTNRYPAYSHAIEISSWDETDEGIAKIEDFKLVDSVIFLPNGAQIKMDALSTPIGDPVPTVVVSDPANPDALVTRVEIVPAKTPVGKGDCGESLTWVLNPDGTLEVFGTGAMAGYSDSDAPWAEYFAAIRTIVLPAGLTAVGENAFFGCTSLAGVVFDGTEKQWNTKVIVADNAFPAGVKVLFAPCPGHSFTNYQSAGEATCQANATEKAECDFCYETDTREIADSKADHKFVTYIGNDDATCQKNETETAKCEFGCGETDTREIADSKEEHTPGEWITEVEPTATTEGSRYKICVNRDCGMELERESIPATGPVEVKNGLYEEDGAWVYYVDGEIAYDYTGLVLFNGVWFYVDGGVVDFGYTGLTLFNGVWMFVSGGMVDFEYAGMTFFNGVWFYVSGGQVNWNYVGLTLYNGTWFYINGGQVDWNYEGMTFFNGTWFYVSGGCVNWDYVGLTCYNGVWFYISGGCVDWSYNSLTLFNGTWFYINGGMVDWNYTGLVFFNGVEFYVSGGMVDWSFNGPVGDKNVVGGMVVA